jgi:D-aminopeptidase
MMTMRKSAVTVPSLLALIVTLTIEVSAQPRARDLGVPFDGEPGPYNAITDVPGVEVGHVTLIAGEGELHIGKGPVRTGVTAILPTGKHWRPIFAAWHAFNGNGELTGTAWVEESGCLEEPILLTNTRSVGAVHEAVWSWRLARGYFDKESGFSWAALPVVGETWDGRLNGNGLSSIQGRYRNGFAEGRRRIRSGGSSPGQLRLAGNSLYCRRACG